jgi:hypothetical protein
MHLHGFGAEVVRLIFSELGGKGPDPGSVVPLELLGVDPRVHVDGSLALSHWVHGLLSNKKLIFAYYGCSLFD